MGANRSGANRLRKRKRTLKNLETRLAAADRPKKAKKAAKKVKA